MKLRKFIKDVRETAEYRGKLEGKTIHDFLKDIEDELIELKNSIYLYNLTQNISEIRLFEDMANEGSQSGKELFYSLYDLNVKNNIEDELADIVITVFSVCEELGIDIVNHLKLKALYNKLRKD